jgi:alpha,alpha-trehalase
MSVYYNISRACTIYCYGPVLQTIQLAQIFNDSKTFVDMPMINEPEETLNAFYAIPDTSNITQLKEYVNNYFLPAGSDLVQWIPDDYQENPPIYLDMPSDYKYKQFTKDLNQLWTILGRNVSESVITHPEKHSFTPYKYPFVVPGGRFRESYYWDSWWIMRGLLVCNMNTTAYYVISNLISDIQNFGFVPNGGRIYYLDRSQPPVLSEMVLQYFRNNFHGTREEVDPFLATFLYEAFEALVIEYHWWMNETNGHVVTLANGTVLNRYYSNATTPRPESYYQDYTNSLPTIRTTLEVNDFYQNIRAGAESGWDFSSRWIEGMFNISDIDTTNIIPIELNAFMYQNEINLARIQALLQIIDYNETEIQHINAISFNFTEAATQRYRAIQEYLWDHQSYHWRDYNLTSNAWAVRNGSGEYNTIAYYLPLWARIYPVDNLDDIYIYLGITSIADTTTCNRFVHSFKKSGLLQKSGVLTTTANTNQQWDAPNAWPPLMILMIEGLTRLGCPNALHLAANLTETWLETNYLAFNATGYMYEKYNAYTLAEGGGGGEYTPQVGFGWTNGIALILINDTYRLAIHDFNFDDDWFDDDDGVDDSIIAIAVLLPFFFILFLTCGLYFYCVRGQFLCCINRSNSSIRLHEAFVVQTVTSPFPPAPVIATATYAIPTPSASDIKIVYSTSNYSQNSHGNTVEVVGRAL